MKKTSLYLSEDLDDRIARRAEDEGLSKAEFIRRTLEGAITRPRRPKLVGAGSLRNSGNPGWWSSDIDRALEETGFGETPPERKVPPPQ